MQSLMGLVGVVSLILVAVIFSSNRKAINLRTVGGAFLLQAAIPAFVIFTQSGATVLKNISAAVQVVIDSANVGISFVFGGLAGDKMFELFGSEGWS